MLDCVLMRLVNIVMRRAARPTCGADGEECDTPERKNDMSVWAATRKLLVYKLERPWMGTVRQ